VNKLAYRIGYSHGTLLMRLLKAWLLFRFWLMRKRCWLRELGERPVCISCTRIVGSYREAMREEWQYYRAAHCGPREWKCGPREWKCGRCINSSFRWGDQP
jgi:hypothetical protein